jgi:hypothetical protein
LAEERVEEPQLAEERVEEPQLLAEEKRVEKRLEQNE